MPTQVKKVLNIINKGSQSSQSNGNGTQTYKEMGDDLQQPSDSDAGSTNSSTTSRPGGSRENQAKTKPGPKSKKRVRKQRVQSLPQSSESLNITLNSNNRGKHYRLAYCLVTSMVLVDDERVTFCIPFQAQTVPSQSNETENQLSTTPAVDQPVQVPLAAASAVPPTAVSPPPSTAASSVPPRRKPGPKSKRPRLSPEATPDPEPDPQDHSPEHTQAGYGLETEMSFTENHLTFSSESEASDCDEPKTDDVDPSRSTDVEGRPIFYGATFFPHSHIST